MKKATSKGNPSSIVEYLDPLLITFLDVKLQEEALNQMVDLLDQRGRLHDRRLFFEAIINREKIVSTGIGVGVAIPHAKLEGYEEFFIAIGIQKGNGIPWQAIDHLPARIIIMIGGPDYKQIEYLNILSMITVAIKDEERRKSLLKARNPEEVIAVFKDV